MIAPTDRELDALKILWDRGRATVRAVWTELRRDDAELAYTSILSLLQSMEQKGLVRHEEVGRAYEYIPTISKADTTRTMTERFVRKVFDGAMDSFLVKALEASQPDAETIRKLEALLADARSKLPKTGSAKRGRSKR